MIELKNLIKFAKKKLRPSKNKKPFSIAFNIAIAVISFASYERPQGAKFWQISSEKF